jgi:hypothetical protein
LWAGNSGFKLVLLKMESNDPPDKVAAFYRKALEKYGKVLSCPDSLGSSGTAKSSDGKSDGKNDTKKKDLECDDDDKPQPGEVEFKAGIKDSQHMVAIEPNGTGTLFSLLYVEAKGSDSDKDPI